MTGTLEEAIEEGIRQAKQAASEWLIISLILSYFYKFDLWY